MDCRRIFVAAGATCLAFVMGCNSGDSAAPPTAGAASSGVKKPNEVVRTFLEAIRTGNNDLASQMLTEVARTETQKHELVVAPPGSDTAHFEIGEVEYVVKDELAHVASKWTDTGEDGQPHTDEIVWALRLDPQGWRIAGMATTVFPNEPPLLLDFEKPEEMMEQQRMAEAEIRRRAGGAGSGSKRTNSSASRASPGPRRKRGESATTAERSAPCAKSCPSQRWQCVATIVAAGHRISGKIVSIDFSVHGAAFLPAYRPAA